MLWAGTGGNNLQIRKNPGKISLAGSVSGYPFNASKTEIWYRMKFRLEGSNLMGKMWEDGSPEPASWDVTIIDASYTTGEVGIGLYNSKAYFDDIEIKPL